MFPDFLPQLLTSYVEADPMVKGNQEDSSNFIDQRKKRDHAWLILLPEAHAAEKGGNECRINFRF